MEHVATPRPDPLRPSDWIQAAFARLSAQGIEAVRIEVLARDLGVSKGSFYWHFRDRGALLEEMLSRWERGELTWLNAEATDVSAASRWAQILEKTADPERVGGQVALVAWARADQRVAIRVAAIEKAKTSLIADVLRDIGFARPAAEYWSELVWLLCLGWMDRAARDSQFQLASRGLGELLSEVILAASARTSAPNR